MLLNSGEGLGAEVVVEDGGTINVGCTPNDSSRLKFDPPSSGFKVLLAIVQYVQLLTLRHFYSISVLRSRHFTDCLPFQVLQYSNHMFFRQIGVFVYFLALADKFQRDFL